MSYPKRMTTIQRDQIKPYTLRLEQLHPGESTTFSSKNSQSIALLRSRLYVWFCTQGYDKRAFKIVRESQETIRVHRVPVEPLTLYQSPHLDKSTEPMQIAIGEITTDPTETKTKTKTTDAIKDFVAEELKDLSSEDEVITLANKARAEKRISPAQVLEAITLWKEKRRR